MFKRILVTGGAGFIGSQLVDALIKKGCQVKVLDNLEPQVHGKNCKYPKYLNKKADFIKNDICNKNGLMKALENVEVIFHLCANVGVGQSMYEITKYARTNTLGTANLLNILATKNYNIKKLIVASSMSIYGEGAYHCKNCGMAYPAERKFNDLKNKLWEMKCSKCTDKVTPVPTPEDKPLNPTSIYAVTKRDQEEMCLSIGKAYNIPTTALRYFNVYGERQSLSNPYTGVAAIFSSRILNNHSPAIFEDGLQSRDFVYVDDIIQANILAMEKEEANYQVFNVGTGKALTILDVANVLIRKFNFKSSPVITNKFREGDIRHCFSDITKITKTLGYKPKVSFEEGMSKLINGIRTQKTEDKFEKVFNELKRKKLIH